MRQISDEEIKEIRNLYSNGKSSYEISKLTGWHRNTVMFYIYEPKDRGRYTKLTIPQIEEINRLYDSGITQKELAKKYSLVQSTISAYIWNPRKRWDWIKERKKTALESSQTKCSS